MRLPDLRRLLSAPSIYRRFRQLVAGPHRDAAVLRSLDVHAGHRILDIGCAGGDVLALLPPTVSYVGLDASESYIEAARTRFGDRGTFHLVEIGTGQVPALGHFDRVLADGVLHHLDDEAAAVLLSIAAAALRADGLLVTIDPCFAEGQTWLVRRLLKGDRGNYVRTEPDYVALAKQAFTEVRTDPHDKLLRLPYQHLLMQCRQPHPAEVVSS